MKCESCGMEVKGAPVLDIIRGKKYYYCCKGCRDYNWCQKSGVTRKLWTRTHRRVVK